MTQWESRELEAGRKEAPVFVLPLLTGPARTAFLYFTGGGLTPPPGELENT